MVIAVTVSGCIIVIATRANDIVAKVLIIIIRSHIATVHRKQLKTIIVSAF